MLSFRYTALDVTGKEQKGTLQGESSKHIRSQLRQLGLIPLVIESSTSPSPTTKSLSNIFQWQKKLRLNLTELVFFTRQLALLIQAGFTIEQALEGLEEQFTKTKIKTIIRNLCHRVREGSSLSQAIACFPHAFPAIYSVSIEAGEQSGQLAVILSRLADYAEQQQHIRQKIQQALIYPSITLLFSAAITLFLLTYLLPTLLNVFNENQQSLPSVTLVLLYVSQSLNQYGLIFLLGLFGAVSLLRYSLKYPAHQRRWHVLLLRLPIIKTLIKTSNSARYTRTLGLLCASGLPALEAMRLSAKLVTSIPMHQHLTIAANRVREGNAIHLALKQTQLFDPLTLNLIANGEQSGKLAELLQQASHHQENQLTRFIQLALTLLEPAMIIVMGGIVLFIVLAMLLPIFAMNQLI